MTILPTCWMKILMVTKMNELFKQNLFEFFKNTSFEEKERIVQNIVMNCTAKELEMIARIVDKEIYLSGKAIAEGQEVDDRE